VKKVLQYALYLLLISIICIAAGLVFSKYSGTALAPGDIIWLTLAFCANTLISIFIFLKGQTKEGQVQGQYTLVSITLKFLVELFIALFWFLIAKKTIISFTILFFIVYLTFTFFSIFVILNTLKNKSL
jgi:hypothetical protein